MHHSNCALTFLATLLPQFKKKWVMPDLKLFQSWPKGSKCIMKCKKIEPENIYLTNKYWLEHGDCQILEPVSK